MRRTRRSRRRSIVETLFDFFVAGGADRLGALDRRAADAPGLLAHPDRRLEVLPAPRACDGDRARRRSLVVGADRVHRCARAAASDVLAPASAGLRDPRRPPPVLLGVIVPQAISWVLRIASLFFFLQAFGVHANVHNALLAQVVDSLATLFPATPGGAGTKQGLIVFLFRGAGDLADAAARVQRRHEHRDRRRQPRCSGLIAIGLMARTLSFKRLRQRARQASRRAAPAVRAVRLGLSARDGARGRARVHVRGRRTASGVGAIVRVPFGRSRARGIVVALDDAAARRRRGAADRGGRRRGAAGARRARALARRLLRLDAGARARARRAGDAEAAQGAGAAGGAAGARRRGRAGRALARRSARRSRGSSTAIDAGGGNVPALRRDRLAARPRCTSRRARRCSSAGSARSCSCRRSRSRRRPSAASARASATASRSSTRG